MSSSKPLLIEIYHRLLEAYGPQGWWPAESRFEMIAGAILTQAASWRNVELALDNLRSAGVESWRAVHELPLQELAGLVRPSGYYNAKGAQAEGLCRPCLRGL